MLLALLVGVATLWVRQAQREARRFEDARKLVRMVIFEIQPALGALPATLPLRRKLLEGSLAYLAAISRDAGGNVALLEELAGGYLELSKIQGNPLHSNLGDPAAAQRSLEAAQALIRQARAASPWRPEGLSVATQISVRLAEHAHQQSDFAAASRYARQAVDLADRYCAARPEDTEGIWWTGVARFTHALSMPSSPWQPRVEEFARAAAFALEAAARHPSDARYRRTAASAYRRIAEIYSLHDEHGPALEYALQTARISDELLAASPDNPQAIMDAAASAAVLGQAYDYSGRDPESLPHYQRALELLDRAQTADPLNVRLRERLAIAARDYALGLIQTGALIRALAPARRAVETFQSLEEGGQLTPIWRPGFAFAWYVLGRAEQGRGKLRAACQAYRISIERLEAADRAAPLAANWRDILSRVRDRARGCPPDLR